MRTVFRTTATLPDRSGKFRTSIILACKGSDANNGAWSEEAKREHIKREALPTAAYDISDEEFAAMEADNALRFGYADKPGDIATPLVPTPWLMGF
jgi:hypothetical protein